MNKGRLLLNATLEEIIKIAEMGIDLSTDQRFHFDARVQYEALANVKFFPVYLLMCNWQSGSQGSQVERSPQVFQSVHDVPELSSGADVPCCS